jgi:hypothetical protein
MQPQQRIAPAWLTHQYGIARAQQHAKNQVDGLGRAGGGEYLRRMGLDLALGQRALDLRA